MSSSFYSAKTNCSVRTALCSLSLGLSLMLCAHVACAADWHAELPQAKEVGQGELRWFGLKIYSASLWSEQLPFDQDAPFALKLTYHRHITREKFADVSIDEIRRLFEHRYSEEKLQQWRKLIVSALYDVNEGDQIIGIYQPQKGCRFYDSNKLLADINDPEFAQAFFAIWLDPRSKDSKLREHLLSLSK